MILLLCFNCFDLFFVKNKDVIISKFVVELELIINVYLDLKNLVNCFLYFVIFLFIVNMLELIIVWIVVYFFLF